MMAVYPGGYPTATAKPPAAPPKATAAPNTSAEPDWVKGLREALGSQAYDQGTANKVAASQAKAQTAAQLAAYHAAQAQELAAAQGRATQIGNLGTTVANYLGQVYNPAGVAQDYGNAIAGQQALGTGYANQFQANADQAAALAQQQIAASGGQGSAGSQAGSLASALTGLSVNLPANALGIQQLAAVEAAKAAPGLALGYAQQEATGALGAGQDAAAKYRPDITAAIAGEPALASKYLADYIAQATKAHQDQIGNAFKLAGLSQSATNADNLNKYRYDSLTAADNRQIRSLNASADRTLATLKAEDIRQIRSINAANGRADDANAIRVQIANASNALRAQGITLTRARLKEQIAHDTELENRGLTSQQIQVANALGYFTDPKTGARTPIKGYRLTPTGVKKIPTASAGSRLTQTQRDQMSSASQSAYLAANGGTTQGEKPAFAVYADPGDGTGWSKPLYAPDGVKVIGYINYLPPIDLADALNRARASANPAVAVKAVRRAYKEAQANRKFTSETVAKIGPLFAPTVP